MGNCFSNMLVNPKKGEEEVDREKWTRGMMIKIQTMAGKEFLLQVYRHCTIKDVKRLIQNKEGIPLNDQKLLFGGVQLKNESNLAECGIKNGETVFLSKAVRGGNAKGEEFADLSDDSKLKHVKFSSSAPSWRMVKDGLNLEGECNNKKCEAWGKGWVISPWGYRDFVLNTHREKVECPECGSNIKVVTCGFLNTYWKYNGLKSDKPDKLYDSEWKQASKDEYWVVSPEDGKGKMKLVRWTFLVISTKKLSNEE